MVHNAAKMLAIAVLGGALTLAAVAAAPGIVAAQSDTAVYESDTFGLSFHYPGEWTLSESEQRAVATLPGLDATFAAHLDILSEPVEPAAYTDIVLDGIASEHYLFAARDRKAAPVGALIGESARVEVNDVDGNTTVTLLSTAVTGRMGFSFMLTGEVSAVETARRQFQSVVATSQYPGASFEPPAPVPGGIRLGIDGVSAEEVGRGESRVFTQDIAALTAVVSYRYAPLDAPVRIQWVQVDGLLALRLEVSPVEVTEDDGVYTATYTAPYRPDGGMDPGLYLVVARSGGTLIGFAPYAVVEELGNEFDTPTLGKDRAALYWDWAGFSANVGDWERVVYAATKAIALGADDAQIYWWRAEAYESQCKILKAIDDHKRAEERAPNHPVALLGLGHTYWYAFNHDKADDYLTRALGVIADMPRETEAQQARADYLAGYGYNIRALVRAEIQKFGAGLADVDAALAIEPGEHHYIDTRAYVLLRSGRIVAAIDAYEQALALDFHNTYVYLGLGLAHDALLQPEAARPYLEQGLALFETHAERACPDPQLSYLTLAARAALDRLPQSES